MIRRGWFRRTARHLFAQEYHSHQTYLYLLWAGFRVFQQRWGISCRALTKKASRLPEEYQCLVANWLRFNRRNSQPRNPFERAHITTSVGCFESRRILNIDKPQSHSSTWRAKRMILKDRGLYPVKQIAVDGISGRLLLLFTSSLMEPELESSQRLYFMRQLERIL